MTDRPNTYSPDLLDSYLRIVFQLRPDDGTFGNSDRLAMARLLDRVAQPAAPVVVDEAMRAAYDRLHMSGLDDAHRGGHRILVYEALQEIDQHQAQNWKVHDTLRENLAKAIAERDELRSKIAQPPAPAAAAPAEVGPFARGARVHKTTGFRYPGVVAGCVQNIAGEWRAVVEAEHEEFKGMLHIYRPDQLARLPAPPTASEGGAP